MRKGCLIGTTYYSSLLLWNETCECFCFWKVLSARSRCPFEVNRGEWTWQARPLELAGRHVMVGAPPTFFCVATNFTSKPHTLATLT